MLALVIALSIFSVPASFSGSLHSWGGAQRTPAWPQTGLAERKRAFPRGGTRSSRVGSDWSTSEPGPALNQSQRPRAQTGGGGGRRETQARPCDHGGCGPLGPGGCSMNQSRGLWLAERRAHARPKPAPWQKGAKQCSGQHPPEPGGWGSPSTMQGLEVGRSCSEEEAMRPPPSFSVTQLTWPPCFPTSPAGSSSTPSSTWVPSGCSRCSSQTRPSCRAS